MKCFRLLMLATVLLAGSYTYGETLAQADGTEYVGDVVDGQPHGQGTVIWAGGDKYVGKWKDGLRHGQGTLTRANGDEYVGAWKANKLHGKGTFTYGRSYNPIWCLRS